MYQTFSYGVFRSRYLPLLLDKKLFYCPFALPKSFVDGILVWGNKPTARYAQSVAIKKQIPLIRLEDGFLRSLGLGVDGDQALSLILDKTGIYYDARHASDLEWMIKTIKLDIPMYDRSIRCMGLIRKHRLSKYNLAPDVSFEPSTQKRVLVVDQTCGDASIEFGGASSKTFVHMLNTALKNHPDAEIIVKVHPDVVARKKQGHLYEQAVNSGCTVISEACNVWSLLDVVSDVYVVTSQVGFEALIAEKRVHCFGLPFYGGWGLTIDEIKCPRRRGPISIEALFYAAYILYCKYIDPVQQSKCEIEDVIDYLVSARKDIGLTCSQ